MILRGEANPTTGQDHNRIVRRILIIAVVFVITMCGLWAAPTIQASVQLQPKQQAALPANKIQPVRLQDDLHVADYDGHEDEHKYEASQWKYYVVVKQESEEGDLYSTYCGGGVLSPYAVVTAGHCCVKDSAPISVFYFGDGVSDGAKNPNCKAMMDEGYDYSHKHDEVISGEGAKQWSPINDICVVWCAGGIGGPYKTDMAREEFPKLGTDMPDEFYFVGAGVTTTGGPNGNFRWAKLPRGDCIANHAFDKKENKDDLIARYPQGDGAFQQVICTVGTTFPCSGDSGSPLWNADKTRIYGVLVDIKWRECTEGPAWFTNLVSGEYASFVDVSVEVIDQMEAESGSGTVF